MTQSPIKISKWKDNLSVGVELIDNEHKQLFSLLRQLSQIIQAEEVPSDKTIEEFLNDLYAHMDLHFSREEALMKACGYPHYENHRHVHSMIRAQVKYYLDSFEKFKTNINLELLQDFMETWLIDHVGSMDKSYSKWMIDKEDLIDKTNSQFEATWKRDNYSVEVVRRLKILVVDDEEDICNTICAYARRLHQDSKYITDAEQFFHIYSNDINVVVLDLFMPGIDGVELIRFLADKNSKASIILMSGKDSRVLHSAKIVAESRGLNVVGVLNKPFNREDINLLFTKIAGQNIRQSIKSNSGSITVEEMQEAIDREEIIPYFQPKVRIDTGEPIGFEALARWLHPEKGLISPSIFIPLFEEYNLIGELTELMMEKTFFHTSEWIKDGLEVKLSINISPVLLKTLDTPEKILNLANKYSLDSSIVTLEVTESAMSEELANSLDILTRIRMKGFLLSIDDFGTGYSSMMQLNRAPFNELKVDQSFVKDIDVVEENRAICESTVDLAHKLNMTICAEGIETKAVWNILKGFYCTEGQGSYFGKPMPANDFSAWFKERLN
jgi:hemerythrin-like metal-binding protein